jgi:radical SAM protein with 4Fe4S-binding SPASM domain
MLSVSRLLNGTVGPQDALRYGRSTRRSPPHLLHFSEDKKPVVVWNCTQRCNLHCAHCYSNSFDRDYPGELATCEGLALISELARFGVPTVLFSGGEPLTRPDLFTLAEAARSAGMRTVLSTNGVLIDDATATRIAAAGFSYVGVSFDGIGQLHDRMRGKKGAFDAALAGIRAARGAGLRTGVRFTLHALNRRDMGAVFDLAEREGVDRLCVYHLAYAGRGEKMRKFDLAPAETRAAVEEIFDRAAGLHERGSKMEVLTVDNPVDGILLLFRVRRTEPERAAEVEQMLRWNGGNQSGVAVACIDPQGKVHPDQFSWQATVGDVREQKFSEIWCDANPALWPYRRRPRRLGGRCARCQWQPMCNGGLRVRAESATGDFTASDPACYLHEGELAPVEAMV